MTIYGKLVAKQEDFGGFVNYVFENSEPSNNLDKFFMCTRYPNWQTSKINIGEKGFIEFEERVPGRDTWFDGKNKVGYKYAHVQFLNFIPDNQHNTDKSIIL